MQFHQSAKENDSYCRIRQAFQFNVKRPYERKTSILLYIFLFVIAAICILLLIGAAAKWKFSMNTLMVRLRNELKRRQTSLTKGSSVDVLHRI